MATLPHDSYEESISVSVSGATFYLKAELTENSYSVANNTSSVTASATLRAKSGGSAFSGSGGTLYVDWWDNRTSSWTNKGSVSISSLSTGSSKSISKTFNVSHNNNGSLRGEVRARWVRGTNNYAPGSRNVYTDEISLSDIPRQSGITISKYNKSIADNVILITIDRKLSSYTDTISWTCGNLSETIQTKGSATKIALYFDDNAYNTIAPPTGYTKKRSSKSNVNLMNLIPTWSSSSPDNPNQTIVFTTSTYNGNTLIGSNTYNFKYEIYQTPFINNLTYETTDSLTATLTGATDVVINGISRVLVTNVLTKNQYFNDNVQATSFLFSASGVGGGQVSTNTYTFEYILGSIIRGLIVDARNKTTSMSQGAIELDNTKFLDYFTPEIASLVTEREESTSNNISVSVTGKFWNNSFGLVSNQLTLKYRTKLDDADYPSTYTTINPTIVNNEFTFEATLLGDSDKQFTIEFVASDSTGKTFTLEASEPKGGSIFDIGDDYFNVNGVFAINGIPVLEYEVVDTW